MLSSLSLSVPATCRNVISKNLLSLDDSKNQLFISEYYCDGGVFLVLNDIVNSHCVQDTSVRRNHKWINTNLTVYVIMIVLPKIRSSWFRKLNLLNLLFVLYVDILAAYGTPPKHLLNSYQTYRTHIYIYKPNKITWLCDVIIYSNNIIRRRIVCRYEVAVIHYHE